MAKAIAEISVNEKIRAALVDNQGELYEVLRLICAYERADWESVAITMIRKDIGVEAITKAFLDALIWYKELLENEDSDSEADSGNRAKAF